MAAITSVTDNVMLTLEQTSQLVPMEREGWATIEQMKKVATYNGTGYGFITSKNLHQLVALGRAERKVVGSQALWKPVRSGGGAGGNSDIFGYREPDTTPRGGKPEGSRSPEDYGDITPIAGAAGAAGGMAGGTVGAVVRSSLF